MLSNVLRTGPGIAFLFALAPAASGQVSLPGLPATPEPPAPAQPPARVNPAQPAQPATGVQPATGTAQPVPAATTATYRAKQILGSKIMLAGNTSVGTVDDIVFDGAGNLDYLIVANEGKLVTVPWDAAKFDLKTQTATLTITPEVYRTIPTYTTTTYPDFWTPTYRTQVYKYYGLTPRELRRIDRVVRP